MLAGLRARCGSSSPRVRLRGRPGPGFCDGGALAAVLARHCARALLIFGALLAGTLPAAGADDAERWLERMGSALRTENYVGVVTYVRGPEIDSVRVVHRVAGGREYERLIHLNGQPREIYTEGARSVYLQPQGATIAPHGVSLGPFTRTFHDNLALNRNLYDVTVGSAGRVAGRSAQQLLIRPRQGDRYGYELWLDQSTGLLLQSVLVDGGQILEAFQFANAILDDVPAKNLFVDIGKLNAGCKFSKIGIELDQGSGIQSNGFLETILIDVIEDGAPQFAFDLFC